MAGKKCKIDREIKVHVSEAIDVEDVTIHGVVTELSPIKRVSE